MTCDFCENVCGNTHCEFNNDKEELDYYFECLAYLQQENKL